MSVAGIAGFLEERSVDYRKTKNGLYSTPPFLLSNTLAVLRVEAALEVMPCGWFDWLYVPLLN
ncbi:hypothetical protein R3P38DRAFT_2961210 [Favolaschia claudopus]|uniref:Uncharacterized protein n=1 Tax=Favolaschia claudopus TaxID=2862362 RepID=A0AAW0B8Q6_9AGAR